MIQPEEGFTILKQVKKDQTRASGLIVPGETTSLIVVSGGFRAQGASVIANLKEAIKCEYDHEQYLIVPTSAIVATIT